MKIIDNGRCACSPYSQDLVPCNFAFFPRLKAERKCKHLNDLDELRLESTNILYSYPLEWFDEVYIVSGSSNIVSALCHKRCTLRKTDIAMSFKILICDTSWYMASIN